MRNPLPRSTGLAMLAMVAAVSLVACASDDDTGAAPSSTLAAVAPGGADAAPSTSAAAPVTPPATEPRPTEPVATDPPVTDPPVTDPPVTDPPVTDPPVEDGTCLVGDWVVTEAEMDGYYAGLMSTLDSPVTIDTDGSAPLSFGADGTYEWAPMSAIVVEVAGQSGTGDVGGTITGDWTAADGVVTTASEVNALSVSITVSGTTFDGADFANGLLNSSPVNGVTYSCDGPAPVLDFKTSDPGVTVPVTLTPA